MLPDRKKITTHKIKGIIMALDFSSCKTEENGAPLKNSEWS